MQLKLTRIIFAAAALCTAVIAVQAAEPAPVSPAKESAAAPATFRGIGKLLDVDVPNRLVTVDHDDMPSLGMPAMTMDFPVAISVDMTVVRAGETVSFVLTLIDGILTVTELRLLDSP
ncbi:copper-binding protein [Azohydromonas lata]|uniref:Copper-binding protein n=1 Tax=Azohydromonas lata TaxID=45677 RepID=A0ABU5I980_9BURK|nr:copper-binding protein [Azohydromonas lata]MDZ5455653.1 copper-binding protein [Azohydromonas lata]